MFSLTLLPLSHFVGSKKLDTAAFADSGVKLEKSRTSARGLKGLIFLAAAVSSVQSFCPCVAAQNEPSAKMPLPLNVGYQDSSAAASNTAESPEVQSSSQKNILPVLFPAPIPHVVPAPTRIAMPSVAAPTVPAPAVTPRSLPNGRVNVSIMKGEVHMRNLNPKMASGEILNLSTGDRSSCEFKLNGATGRVWQNSDATVFSGSNVVMLNNGELVLQVRRATSSGEFTVISGDLLCRVSGTTIHVSRHDGHVQFRVVEGTVTVYNRQTGEILKVSP